MARRGGVACGGSVLGAAAAAAGPRRGDVARLAEPPAMPSLRPPPTMRGDWERGLESLRAEVGVRAVERRAEARRCDPSPRAEPCCEAWMPLEVRPPLAPVGRGGTPKLSFRALAAAVGER